MTQALTIKQKVASVRELLDKTKGQIALALPRHCTPDRMVRVALTALQRTPRLLDCTPYSLQGAIVQASQLGLETDGVLGHAYLVPFNNRKTGKLECQLIPGYKGLVDLARRSGTISTIYAQVVHEHDEYDFHYGLQPDLRHKPTADEEPGPPVAFYAVARLRDGGAQFEWMWKRQVDAIRAGSKAKNDGPWVTHYIEMGKKTVLRRLCKILPVSVELQKAVALDEHAEAGIPQDLGTIVTVDSDEPEPGAADLDTLAEQLGTPDPEATPTPSPQPDADQDNAPPAMSLGDYDEQLLMAKSQAAVKKLRTQAAKNWDLNDVDRKQVEEWADEALKRLKGE